MHHTKKIYTLKFMSQIVLTVVWFSLMEDEVMILSTAGLCSRNKNKAVKLLIPGGIYSIHCFHAKIKEAILPQKQTWKVRQVLDIKLIILEYYALFASVILFDALALLSVAKKGLQKSVLGSGSYQTPLDTWLSPKSLLLHCKYINRVKNEVDG